jgi:hypothetical protein
MGNAIDKVLDRSLGSLSVYVLLVVGGVGAMLPISASATSSLPSLLLFPGPLLMEAWCHERVEINA